MNAAVARGSIPGGVVLIGHNGKVVYRKAFGMRSLEPDKEAMTVDTIFDLASLTKCIATTTSVMKLVQEGKIRLNDPVSVYLPEFAKNGKKDITIRELLTHYSGLTEDLDLKTAWKGREAAFQMAMDQKPVFPPGSRFLYSDINFETLGFIVEKVSGMSMND
jgi:CubicO group peptidase (beta-lactamase class C family)